MIPGKQFDPGELIRVARRRKWLIVIPFVMIATGVAVVTHFLPDQYRSETLILVVPQRVPENYVRSTVTTRIEDRLQSITQQILSRTRLERVIQDFSLYEADRRTDIMEDIVERMRKDIDVQIVKGDAFRVSYSSNEARTAMKVTERLASLFIEENLRDREVLAEGTSEFIQTQLEEARRGLVDNEKRLEEYRRQHSGELPSQTTSNLQGQHNAEMQLQQLVDSLARDQDRRLVLERLVADAESEAAGAAAAATAAAPSDPFAPGLATQEQLDAARGTLRNLELRMKPEHPDVVRMKQLVADLEKKADAESMQRPLSPSAPGTVRPSSPEMARKNRLDEMKAELAGIGRDITRKDAEQKRLRGTIADYQNRIEAAPTRETELAELTRDYETLQNIYRSLLSKKEDSKVAANLERRQSGEQFKILDPARLPEKPTSPDRPRMNLLGLLVAFGIGLGLAAIAEYKDESLRSEDDVRVAIGIAVLATIPFVGKPQAGWWTWRRVARASAMLTVAIGAGAAFAWLKFLR